MIRHRRSVLVGTFALALFFLAGGARAQGWPTRPVTMVAPYAAGGPVDTVGRIMAAGLSEILGQQVVIENVTGAGGMTGTSRVALAAPDGYTFLLGGLAVLGLVPNLYKKPLYNPVTDFAPVSLFADSARILIARKDLPADTLKDFIAYAQTNQAKMQFGSAGAWLGAAYLRRAAQYRHGHDHHPCALSRQRAGDARPDARSDRTPARASDQRGGGSAVGARAFRKRRRDRRGARAPQPRIPRPVPTERTRQMGGSDSSERRERGLERRTLRCGGRVASSVRAVLTLHVANL